MKRSAIVIALAALVLFFLPSHASARMYLPCATANLSSSAPNAPADVSYTFGVGVGPDCVAGTADDAPDYLPQDVIAFTPPSWGVARDSDIPDGVIVGHMDMLVTLGLLENPCNTSLQMPADLVDATTSMSNPIDPLPASGGDRLAPLAADTDSNGVADGVERWPSYLTTLANARNWDLTKLRERIVGINDTAVSGATLVVNLLVFNPGALGDSRLGYATVVVFNDPAAARSYLDTVSDVCSPTTLSYTLFGQAGGVPFRANPSSGSYYFATYSKALPDADDDGVENALDPCPFTVDPGWDPRGPKIQPADRDGDGVPNSCDPHPNGDPGVHIPEYVPQEDGDNWLNRADNCPLVANPDQLDTDGDGIGDACDPHPTVVDGLQPSFCNVNEVTIGGGGASAVSPYYLVPCAGGVGSNCIPTSFGVLAILRELAGGYPHTICFPQVDADCNGRLDVGDALDVLLSQIQIFIIRPCYFYAPPV